MKMLAEFDRWLLEEKFERFAHWFQKATGKDCFWLARLLLVLGGVCMATQAWHAFTEVPMSYPIWEGFMLFIFLRLYFAINKMATEVYTAFRKGLQNPAKLKFALTRKVYMLIVVSFLVFSLVVTAPLGFLMTGMMLSLFGFMYFISCTPLPPSEEKQREWARGRLMRAPTLAPQ